MEQYEVIDNWPECDLLIGLILTRELNDHYSYEVNGRKFTRRILNIDRYPHLFKKL